LIGSTALFQFTGWQSLAVAGYGQHFVVLYLWSSSESPAWLEMGRPKMNRLFHFFLSFFPISFDYMFFTSEYVQQSNQKKSNKVFG
jgi:hypothetical protein